jgi:hypothetical protein
MLELRASVPVTDIYYTAQEQYWWGRPDLAGFDCSLIDRVASLINDYNSLPKGIGSALSRQQFCNERHAIRAIEDAIYMLKTVSS